MVKTEDEFLTLGSEVQRLNEAIIPSELQL